MSVKWRILVVDDEEDIRTIVRATLEGAYELYEASNGLEALNLLTSVEPDLIIADIMMPVMNGYDLCAAVKNHREFSNVGFMFLSALIEKQDIIKGYELGGTQYITKPFTPSRLLKMVQLHFDEAALSNKISGPRNTTNKEQAKQTFTNTKTEAIRVLAIDDDSHFTALLGSWFENTEYDFCWANDGVQAIEKIVAYEPDILLLDLVLPKTSGFQLLQMIKNSQLHQIPVIVITGKGSEKDRNTAIRLGAAFYLIKPVTQKTVENVLAEVVNNKEFRIRPKTMPISVIQAQDNIRFFDPFTTGKHNFGLDRES